MRLCFSEKLLLINMALRKDVLQRSWKPTLISRSVSPFRNYISVACSIVGCAEGFVCMFPQHQTAFRGASVFLSVGSDSSEVAA